MDPRPVVRAATHPNYIIFFKIQRTGAVPEPRLRQMMVERRCDPRVLDEPDLLLPLPPLHQMPACSGLLGEPPMTCVPDGAAAPGLDMALALEREQDQRLLARNRALNQRGKGEAATAAAATTMMARRGAVLPIDLVRRRRPDLVAWIHPLQWGRLCCVAVVEDRPFAMRRAIASPAFALAQAVVTGGHDGAPFAVGGFGFFTDRQIQAQEMASKRAVRHLAEARRWPGRPDQWRTLDQKLGRIARHCDPEACVFAHVELGDSLLHLAGRTFAARTGLLLVESRDRAARLLRHRNAQGELALDVWLETLQTGRAGGQRRVMMPDEDQTGANTSSAMQLQIARRMAAVMMDNLDADCSELDRNRARQAAREKTAPGDVHAAALSRHLRQLAVRLQAALAD